MSVIAPDRTATIHRAGYLSRGRSGRRGAGGAGPALAQSRDVRCKVFPMQEEASISINGTKLSDSEAMTIRVAVDTLANVLAEGLEMEGDAEELTERYMTALSRIQTLLDNREERRK